MRSDLPSGTVTFLFTDVEGSTRLLHELGAEAYAEALTDHRRVIREVCATHGGVEVDTQGDAFFFAFPTAPGALAASAVFTEALASGPIQVRVGAHTGTPLVGEEGYVGPDVHRAARIAAAGHGGQVLVSASTAALVETELTDLGEHRFKDLSASERVYQLGHGTFGPLKTLHQTNLPVPATPFLGREDELAEVVALVTRDDGRLVTLTGPGGTGKTRLALQAAAEASDDYPDGVYWVPLAPLTDPGLVLPAVAAVVEVDEEPGQQLVETLARVLTGRRMLLVLDNVEHLLPHASDEVAKLAAVAGPVVVVTSRERLQVQGEQVYPVPTLQEREAVELFHARALAITPDFREDGSVARLCARLDHLPLALELAAARTVVFSPAQLLDRLSERLDLLRGARDADPRQQTLRATIEWSYELLGGSESALFRRLSVFRGGCTIEAAEAICGADVDDLQSLIDKSLVRRRDSSQGPRFWMLETIREYADEQLEAAGEATAIRHAHADWFVERAERQAIVATAGDVMVLDLERDNMRTAFWWSIEAVPQLAARLAIANHQYWHVRDAFTEATESYAAVLEHVDTLDPLLVGRVQLADGAARFFMSDVDGAQARMDSALRFVTGQPEEIEAVRVLGYVMESRDEPRAAIELHERALALSETFDDRYQRRRSLHALGGAYALAGELETANALGEEAVAIGLADGDDLFIAHAAHNLGDFALRAGDLEEASTRYRQAAAAGRRVGSARTGAYCLAGLAAVAERRGDREEAARLWGTVEAYEDASGTRMNSHERTLYEGILDEAAREHPDAYATGRALMLDEALDAVIDAT